MNWFRGVFLLFVRVGWATQQNILGWQVKRFFLPLRSEGDLESPAGASRRPKRNEEISRSRDISLRSR
jgi:hypothetical protein